MNAAEDGPVVSELVLRPLPEDVRSARAFVMRQMTPYATNDEAGDDLLMAAETVTSEMATNALNAGATAMTLRVQISGDRVVISLEDDAEGDVQIRTQDALAPRGRGLRMIDGLAHSWGVSPAPGGKRVWAEIKIAP